MDLITWLFRNLTLLHHISSMLYKQKHVQNMHGCFYVAFLLVSNNLQVPWDFDLLIDNIWLFHEYSMVHCKKVK
jgi:hypothetical protein